MRSWLGVVLACLMASTAAAGPACTDEPRDKWLPEPIFLARVVADGHRVDLFKTTAGNCYEIYGRNAEGRRIEVYYHPVTAAVVKATVR